MTIERTLLNQLTAQPIDPPTGLAALLHSIHRAPELREWVTLESVALPPIPVWRGEHWGIMTLLAVSTRLEDGTPGWFAPWAALEWSLGDRQVAQKIDLRQHDDLVTLTLRHPRSFANRPANPIAACDRTTLKRQQKLLLKTLDRLLAPSNSTLDLTQLAPLYASLLPLEVYPYYHALIPESKVWLTPVSEEKTLPEAITSPSSKTHPCDLSDVITPWLRQATQLSKTYKLETIQAELQQIDQRRKLPGFRLTIIGEFSRGKSTLINRLLQRELLPVGATPTTATVTSIVPGTIDEMIVNWNSDESDRRPLQDTSWNDLLARDAVGRDREVLANVRLTLEHPWLRSLNAELIDTPGAGDLNGQRAALVSDLLSQSDAAVLVISASMPFSLTERAFLEQEVLGRHVPLVLVVVSKLDTIPLPERSLILRVIQERINLISPAIPVLPAYPIDDNTTEETTLATIRDYINVMATQSDRHLWRSQQMAGQIQDTVERMVSIGAGAAATARLSAVERQQVLQQAETDLLETNLQWETVRTGLEQRRIQKDVQLRERIQAIRQDVMEALAVDLSRTPEPKVWWERDLPFRMRRELVLLSRQLEESLLKAIAQDMDWLDETIARTFGTRLNQKASFSNSAKIQPSYTQMTLSNTSRYRLLTRLGSSVATLGGYVLGGPVGIIASTGIWLLGEQLLDKEVNSQRQQLNRELERCIGYAIDTYANAVSDRLRQVYQQLVDETQREQTAWQSARRAALQSSAETPDEDWSLLIEQAGVLKQHIKAALHR